MRENFYDALPKLSTRHFESDAYLQIFFMVKCSLSRETAISERAKMVKGVDRRNDALALARERAFMGETQKDLGPVPQ